MVLMIRRYIYVHACNYQEGIIFPKGERERERELPDTYLIATRIEKKER